MIKIIGGAKTAYNLHKILIKNNIQSEFYFFENEYGKNKNGGKSISHLEISKYDNLIVTSETAFASLEYLFRPLLPTHYKLREKINYQIIAEKLNILIISNLDKNVKKFPVILKPKLSGEKIVPFKIKIINSQYELNSIDESVLENCFIQPYLSENEYDQIDIGGYFNGSINSLICFKEMSQFPMGIASYVKLFESLNSIKLLKSIEIYLNEIEYVGFIEMEFKRSKSNDQFYLMDINPRPWGCSYFYLSAIENIREVFLENDIPLIRPKNAWINLPRLLMSNIYGNKINPSLKDILKNNICYEKIF